MSSSGCLDMVGLYHGRMSHSPFETPAERKARYYGTLAGHLANVVIRLAIVVGALWWAVSLTRKVDALQERVERVEARLR